MTDVAGILEESFFTLLERPKIFIPKLISTSVSSIFFIALFENFSSLGSIEPVLLIFGGLFTLFSLSIISSFAFLMLASMAKRKEDRNILRNSFKETLSVWRELLINSIFLVVISTVLSLIAVLGVLLTRYTGNMGYLILLGSLTAIIIVGVSFASYFLPITLLEFGSFREGFLESFKASKDNSREVYSLVLLSMFLLAIAFFSSGELEKIGYIGFFLGRISSAVVSTYVFIVSPTYYLEKEKEE